MLSFANKKIFLSLLALLIISDQLTKYIIRSRGGFYICNRGIAFGLSLPAWLTFSLITGIILFIGLLIFNLKFKIKNPALILILSGAISNLIDRLSWGCVIDFIDLKVWPIFNLADSFIFLGVLISIINLNRKNQNNPR